MIKRNVTKAMRSANAFVLGLMWQYLGAKDAGPRSTSETAHLRPTEYQPHNDKFGLAANRAKERAKQVRVSIASR